MIEPIEIVHWPGAMLYGVSLKQSGGQDVGASLFSRYAQLRKRLGPRGGKHTFHVSMYPPYFSQKAFKSGAEYTRWAATTLVADGANLEGMEELWLEDGLYAVFGQKGTVLDFVPAYDRMLNEWLPSSGYVWDRSLIHI